MFFKEALVCLTKSPDEHNPPSRTSLACRSMANPKMPGTACHRSGGASFPPRLPSQPESVAAPSASSQKFPDQWQSYMQNLQRTGRGENARQRALETSLKKRLEVFSKKASESLQLQLPLATSKDQWTCVPHTCPQVCLTVTASDVVDCLSLQCQTETPQHLADAWHTRHKAMLAPEVDVQGPKTRVSRCWWLGTCVCGRAWSLNIQLLE